MFPNDFQRYGPQAAPTAPPTLRQSRRYCRRLARRHYENFTVASRLLPRRLRQHVANVYAYCRWADDLADEIGRPAQREPWPCWTGGKRNSATAIAAGPPIPCSSPCGETIRQFDIPADPFIDLLVAFRQDQQVTRYETIEQVLEYCRWSANPVGRLVLYLGRCHTPERVRLADSICTGLQLANFCQDVARDWDRGRIYLPQAACRRFGYDEAAFARREPSDAFRQLLAAQVDQAEGWLRAGLPLAAKMPAGLRLPVALFAAGGLATLEAIRRQNYDVWTKRPTVSKFEKLQLAGPLLVEAAVRRTDFLIRPRDGLEIRPRSCRLSHEPHARRHRSQLRLLPADEPPGRLEFPRGVPLAAAPRSAAPCGPCTPSCATPTTWPTGRRPVVRTRRVRTAAHGVQPATWRTAAARSAGGLANGTATSGASGSRVHRLGNSSFIIHHSSFDRQSSPPWPTPSGEFQIPPEHLFAVLDGVEMDLDRRRYETFDELRQYCDRVASAVGLCCIHIWGFRGPEAFAPARQAGIALQLTNILRDLKEDAAAGRVYLPIEDLRQCGYSADDLLAGVADQRFRRLMAMEVARAERFYAEGAELLDWLAPPGRRMFGLLMATYRALLRRDCAAPGGCLPPAHPHGPPQEAPTPGPLVAPAAAKGRSAMNNSALTEPSRQGEMGPSVAIIGGGLAGLAAAVEAAERGLRVELFEQARFLGGRAGSFVDSQTGQLIDYCPHVALGCCTEFLDFCRRTGVMDCFQRTGTLHFIGPDGTRHDVAASRWLPAPLHLLPGLMRLKYLSLGERWGIVRTLRRLVRVRTDTGGRSRIAGG